MGSVVNRREFLRVNRALEWRRGDFSGLEQFFGENLFAGGRAILRRRRGHQFVLLDRVSCRDRAEWPESIRLLDGIRSRSWVARAHGDLAGSYDADTARRVDTGRARNARHGAIYECAVGTRGLSSRNKRAGLVVFADQTGSVGQAGSVRSGSWDELSNSCIVRRPSLCVTILANECLFVEQQ